MNTFAYISFCDKFITIEAPNTIIWLRRIEWNAIPINNITINSHWHNSSNVPFFFNFFLLFYLFFVGWQTNAFYAENRNKCDEKRGKNWSENKKLVESMVPMLYVCVWIIFWCFIPRDFQHFVNSMARWRQKKKHHAQEIFFQANINSFRK